MGGRQYAIEPHGTVRKARAMDRRSIVRRLRLFPSREGRASRDMFYPRWHVVPLRDEREARGGAESGRRDPERVVSTDECLYGGLRWWLAVVPKMDMLIFMQ